MIADCRLPIADYVRQSAIGNLVSPATKIAATIRQTHNDNQHH
jgi:hypothetical protein